MSRDNPPTATSYFIRNNISRHPGRGLRNLCKNLFILEGIYWSQCIVWCIELRKSSMEGKNNENSSSRRRKRRFVEANHYPLYPEAAYIASIKGKSGYIVVLRNIGMFWYYITRPSPCLFWIKYFNHCTSSFTMISRFSLNRFWINFSDPGRFVHRNNICTLLLFKRRSIHNQTTNR